MPPSEPRRPRWPSVLFFGATLAVAAAGCKPAAPQPQPPEDSRPSGETSPGGELTAGSPDLFDRLTEGVDTTPEERAAIREEWRAVERFRGASTDTFDRSKHVTALVVTGPVTDADFAVLTRLPYLCSLDLTGADPGRVTDAAFEHVARLPRLERLAADGLPLTDEACRHIGKVRTLRLLSLANTRVSDDGLAHLAGLTNLTTLVLSGTTLSGEGLAKLSLPKLATLELQGVRLTTRDLEFVGRFTTLRRLRLPDVDRTAHPVYAQPGDRPRSDEPKGYPPLPAGTIDYAAGLRHLSGLVELERVEMTRALSPADPSREVGHLRWDFAPLTDLSSVRSLFVRTLDTLTPPEVARRHGIRRTAAGDLVMSDFRGGARKEVSLASRRPEFARFLSRPSGELLAHVAGYRNVTSLDLSAFEVHDEDLAHLAKHVGLERLDLSGSPVTAAGLAHLKALPKLKYLNLRGANVGDDDLPALKGFPALRDVVLSQTRVTEAGAETFRRGPVRAVYDPKQKRPWWCDVDWRKVMGEAGR